MKNSLKAFALIDLESYMTGPAASCRFEAAQRPPPPPLTGTIPMMPCKQVH